MCAQLGSPSSGCHREGPLSQREVGLRHRGLIAGEVARILGLLVERDRLLKVFQRLTRPTAVHLQIRAAEAREGCAWFAGALQLTVYRQGAVKITAGQRRQGDRQERQFERGRLLDDATSFGDRRVEIARVH